MSAEKLLQSTIIRTTERAKKHSSTSLSKILGIPTDLNNAGVDIASSNSTVITDSSLEIMTSPTMPTSSVYSVHSETVKKQILGNTDKSDSTDTYAPNGDQNEHPHSRKVVDSTTATYVPNVDQEMDENMKLLFTSEMSTSVDDHDHRPTQESHPKPVAERVEYQHSHHQESNFKGSSSAPNGEEEDTSLQEYDNSRGSHASAKPPSGKTFTMLTENSIGVVKHIYQDREIEHQGRKVETTDSTSSSYAPNGDRNVGSYAPNGDLKGDLYPPNVDQRGDLPAPSGDHNGDLYGPNGDHSELEKTFTENATGEVTQTYQDRETKHHGSNPETIDSTTGSHAPNRYHNADFYAPEDNLKTDLYGPNDDSNGDFHAPNGGNNGELHAPNGDQTGDLHTPNGDHESNFYATSSDQESEQFVTPTTEKLTRLVSAQGITHKEDTENRVYPEGTYANGDNHNPNNDIENEDSEMDKSTVISPANYRTKSDESISQEASSGTVEEKEYQNSFREDPISNGTSYAPNGDLDITQFNKNEPTTAKHTPTAIVETSPSNKRAGTITKTAEFVTPTDYLSVENQVTLSSFQESETTIKPTIGGQEIIASTAKLQHEKVGGNLYQPNNNEMNFFDNSEDINSPTVPSENLEKVTYPVDLVLPKGSAFASNPTGTSKEELKNDETSHHGGYLDIQDPPRPELDNAEPTVVANARKKMVGIDLGQQEGVISVLRNESMSNEDDHEATLNNKDSTDFYY